MHIKENAWVTSEILEATKGELLCGESTHAFSGISIDSRRISTDDLFIAIIGESHDGHCFVDDVISLGVSGIVINKNKAADISLKQPGKRGVVCVAVNDTTKALGDMASFHRKRFNTSVIAITGSNGKTTTKDMTDSVVSRRFNTLSTIGNFNNEIGLPLTLLRLEPGHQWAVLELGTNGPGEIGRLGDICLPDIGVITNIGPAHLEGLGSIEGVAKAKGELLEKIGPGGKVVLNADDHRVLKIAEKATREVLFFGLSEGADVRAMSIKGKKAGKSFTLRLPTDSVSVDLQIPGDFMVSNALAGAAVGYLLGLSALEIKAGLERFKPARGRMNLLMTGNGINIIDDSYNANPYSMEAAIMTLKGLRGRERGILVAGDMFELGVHSEFMHKKIGSTAALSGVKKLYATGVFSESIATGARDENMNPKAIVTGTMEDIFKDLTVWLRPGDWVLVKGSRAMGMEKIVNWLMGWAGKLEI